MQKNVHSRIKFWFAYLESAFNFEQNEQKKNIRIFQNVDQKLTFLKSVKKLRRKKCKK